MNVGTVTLEGSKGDIKSVVPWECELLCEEQKDRQDGLFFNLTGLAWRLTG